MDMGIAGKTALVTASSRGMGANVARALAAERCNVVLFARSEETLRASAAALEEDHGISVLAVPGSMNSPEDVAHLATAIESEFGALDIVILNTGRPPLPLRPASEEVDLQRWDQAYETLLSDVVRVMNAILPLLRRSTAGRIIAISSASVHRTMPRHALSTVFRAGVEAYVRHLSQELGPLGITANCVAPALIETPHRPKAEAYSDDEVARRKRMNSLGRMGTQAELCALVTFLASQYAGFLTGESIRLDGGLTPSLETN